MNNIRLTRRSKIIIAVILTALALVTFWALLDATTPTECKVPAAEMSNGCMMLIYEQ